MQPPIRVPENAAQLLLAAFFIACLSISPAISSLFHPCDELYSLRMPTQMGTPCKPCVLLRREYYMIANPTTIPEWIQCDPLTVTEMVKEIQARYETLDPCRRHMFIEWLQAHNSRVKTAVNVCEGLESWFESMHCENSRWEYRLIMCEIDWWNNLDEQSLTKIMFADLAKSGEQ